MQCTLHSRGNGSFHVAIIMIRPIYAFLGYNGYIPRILGILGKSLFLYYVDILRF